MANKALQALIYGDVFMRVLYKTRPYEKVKGSANLLHEKWKKIAIESVKTANKNSLRKTSKILLKNLMSLNLSI